MKKLFLALLIPSLLFSCGKRGDGKSNLSGSVEIDGSSTVYPISEAVGEEFTIQMGKDVKVKVGESGTGGGFKKFIRKEIDIADASRPIKKSEDSACKGAGIQYIELPIAYDGLVVVVNPQNTWVDKLTVKELKMIWAPEAQGKITKWSQVRKGWPEEKINLYGAGTSSGTFDYFTEAIVGKSKASRGDYTASENDNVLVQGVSGDKGGLGYFGLYYYMANKDKLKLVPVDDENEGNGSGAIAPSEESVRNGTYQPLARPLFIYVNKEASARPEINSFVKFYLQNAETLVKDSKYVPLSKDLYDKVKARFEKGTTGSIYENLTSDVGVKLEDLLKKE
jgi:phosphate transport system substrate-binding protein